MPASAGVTQVQAQQDDLALAQRVAGGDGAAFEQLMRRHNRAMFRTARAILRDDAEAEDALQEAYLQAYRTMGSYRGEARLSTWLARVVATEDAFAFAGERCDRVVAGAMARLTEDNPR